MQTEEILQRRFFSQIQTMLIRGGLSRSFRARCRLSHILSSSMSLTCPSLLLNHRWWHLPHQHKHNHLSSSSSGEFHVKVPSMGDSITEGQVVEISKKLGDSVNVDEVVAVLETDKVSVDVTSQESGVVVGIDVNPGDVVKINATILRLGPTALQANPLQPKVISPVPSLPPAAPTAQSFVPQPPKETLKYEPSIQFKYGKRSGAGPKAPHPQKTSSEPPKKLTSAKTTTDSFPPPAVYGGDEIPLQYKPKAISEKEIEAINTGGLNVRW
eukprot:TRINITY_DN7180_c0_g1_i1.p1 TRINITY_DN7180_c0_g1~~TRINITY_DN7180_c0_g1_i1.p1  ORF type:complete len:270 (-),score=65.06 TRINITY_DN7180_c0_g1_i1:44-853(-)